MASVTVLVWDVLITLSDEVSVFRQLFSARANIYCKVNLIWKSVITS